MMFFSFFHNYVSKKIMLDVLFSHFQSHIIYIYTYVRVNTFLFFFNITEPTNKELEAHIYIQRPGND